MKTIINTLAFIFLSFVTVAQVRFTATNGESIKMKKSNSSKAKQQATLVFFNSDKVPDYMTEIGIMTVKDNDRANAINKAKIYGSRATGDAILLVDAHDQSAAQAVGKFFIGGSAFKGHYIFIVYRTKKDNIH